MSSNTEVWKPIPGWEGFYEVSTSGDVRSLERISRINSVQSGVRKMGGKIRKLRLDELGYAHVVLTAQGRRKGYPVHQLVLMAFKGPRNDGEVGRHLNGDVSNNTPDNLEWGTHLENMADRKAHGNYKFGQRHVGAKLSDEQALYIYTSDECGEVLAERFGVHPTKVSGIRRGRTWKRVTGGVPLPCKTAVGRRSHEKMNFEKAEEVRVMRNAGASLQTIATKFGISPSTAGGICRGKNWVKRLEQPSMPE
jgi:hypothetical protein